MKDFNNETLVVLSTGIVPGRKWKWTRRLTQAIGIFALFVGPLLGGWLRLEQSEFAAWRDSGSDLPTVVSEHLPSGKIAEFAGHVHQFLGGGIAAEYVSIPFMDPVSGTLALMHSHGSWRALIALALPVLLALVAGRLFCGWLCPFGALARGIDRLLDRLPWRPRFQIPPSRPLRWLILGGAIIASFMGIHWLLYVSLPYLLLQQAVYAMWLLGGGGAVLAVLLGLLVAGLILGPTSYCAALCPTGAVLSLLGRARPLRLTIAQPSACGARCNLCDEACWLHLDPASGDPGPDCDLCMRCVSACPRSNLRFTVSKTFGAAAPVILLTLVCTAVSLLAPPAAANTPTRKPKLLFEREHTQGDVTLAISIVDFSGVSLDADAPGSLKGVEVSLFLARGERGPADARGVLPRREVYSGPLILRLKCAGACDGETLAFTAPTSPISTVERTIYRKRLPLRVAQGDEIILEPIKEWLERPVTWVVLPVSGAGSHVVRFEFFSAAVLIFLGVISLAFAFSKNFPGNRNRCPDC